MYYKHNGKELVIPNNPTTRHWVNVYREYEQLTEEQLIEQMAKFRNSKKKHEIGKYLMAWEEFARRRNINA